MDTRIRLETRSSFDNVQDSNNFTHQPISESRNQSRGHGVYVQILRQMLGKNGQMFNLQKQIQADMVWNFLRPYLFRFRFVPVAAWGCCT
jgi:hypothetical protein